MSVWKRVLAYHDYFDQVPAPGKADVLRMYLLELEIREPPTAYRPIDVNVTEKIWQDQGNSHRPPGRVVVHNYLNDFEQFCAAVKEGVVDDSYARELRGTRVIDAFFGYQCIINKTREVQEKDAETRTDSGAAPPFQSKYFLELQLIATKWHAKRAQELDDLGKRVKAADAEAEKVLREAERIRRESRTGHGVAGRLNTPAD